MIINEVTGQMVYDASCQVLNNQDMEDEILNLSQEYVPDITDNSLLKTPEKFDVTPVKFKVTKSKVNELSESTVAKIRQKYKREKQKFKLFYAEKCAPGQIDELMEILSQSSSDEDDDLNHLVTVYRASDALSR